MPAARIVLVDSPSDLIHQGRVVIEQIDFTPAPGQMIHDPASPDIVYEVSRELPVIRQISLGKGLDPKWMNVCKVVRIGGKKSSPSERR